MKFKHCIAIISTLVLASSLICNASTPSYTITDLGASTFAYDINNHGQVVGFFGNSGSEHAFVWQNGKRTDLHAAGDTYSQACGINESGVIVGTYVNSAGTHCVSKWENNVKTQFKELPGSFYASATDINDNGLISVAAFYDSGNDYRSGTTTGYTWNGLSSSPLTSTGSVGAVAVNNSGTVLGSDYESGWWPGSGPFTYYYNYTYKDGRKDDIYVSGTCTGINDSGLVVGHFEQGPSYLYQNQAYMTIRSLGAFTYAYDINNLGQIVGRDYLSSAYDSAYRAVIGNSNGFTDLNTLIAAGSGWKLEQATTINDNGWIIGQGKLNGVDHAFLLTPTPEPSSILALAGGIGALGLFRRKRH